MENKKPAYLVEKSVTQTNDHYEPGGDLMSLIYPASLNYSRHWHSLGSSISLNLINEFFVLPLMQQQFM